MSEKTTSTRPKLILIDGHSLAYRAFFASARTQTFSVKHPDGADELTGAVYFFTNMLLKVWKEEQPDYIAVAFDVGKTFRDELFPEYKGTREKMPDELIAQMKRIQQIVSALGVPIFTKENYEADDVLGTLSVRGSTEGMDVIIVTTANTDDEGRELLRSLGMPFRRSTAATEAAVAATAAAKA